MIQTIRKMKLRLAAGMVALFEPDMERAIGGECVQPGLRVLGLSSGSRAAH